MLPWKAAQVGDRLDQIQTPALILDLQAFERNLALLKRSAGQMHLRPHAKSHKCPDIAKRQIALGAVGICCQKLSEAAVFAQAGIKDILLTNQVVGAGKLARLVELSQITRFGVLVDDLSQIHALAHAMQAQPKPLDVYIEIEVGGGRCGVLPQQAPELAQAIMTASGLHFAGLHCYHGGAQHRRTGPERRAAIEGAGQVVRTALELLNQADIDVPCVTGAGTGTFWLERDSGLYTELQPGSYIFMDRDYADNQAEPDDIRFEHALFILTSVISNSHSGFATVDAGLKAMSVDSGMPAVWGSENLSFAKASDEHGIITLPTGQHLSLGDTLKLVPGHCDPTVNLYDDLIVIENDTVVDIWPIAARGASL